MFIKKIMYDLFIKNVLVIVKKIGLVNCFCLKLWFYYNKFGNIFILLFGFIFNEIFIYNVCNICCKRFMLL